MPTYNAGEFLREAIESILYQSEQDFELIIVNDNSGDDTQAIVQSYKSDKIRYSAHSENLGAPRTRNKTLDMARGEYIAIADSDDISHPQRLAIQAGFLENYPTVGVVGARIRAFERKPPAFDNIPTGKVKIRLQPEQIKSRLIFNSSSAVAHAASMIRRRTLEKHRIFYNINYPVAEDFHLFQQLGLVTDMVELDATLYLYRIHSRNISKNRKIIRRYSLQTRIEFLKKKFDIDISDVFNDEGSIKSTEKFTRLAAEVEKIIETQKNNPQYDAEILYKGGVKFLYKSLRELENQSNDYGAVYAAYRKSKLLRRLKVNRKLRFHLKALFSPRSR